MVYNNNGENMRNKIEIDHLKCNGCGACLKACRNHVLQIVNGQCVNVNADLCALNGSCIGACPNRAISMQTPTSNYCVDGCCEEVCESELYNWPLNLSQIDVHNTYLANSDLLIAASCTAYAYANFHQDFIKDRTVLITCPKLEYKSKIIDKLTRLFSEVNFSSVKVIAMSATCCEPLIGYVEQAIATSQQKISVHEYVLSKDGELFG